MPSESTSEVQRSGHGRCAHPLEGPERGAAVVLAIGPTMVTRLVGRRREQDPLAMLSDRKRKVLGHMAQGLPTPALPTNSL